MRTLPVFLIAALVALVSGDSTALGQSAGYSPAANQPIAQSAHAATGYERVSGRNNPAVQYFGGAKTAAYTAPARPVASLPQPVQVARYGKPFSGVSSGPTISPYLALDARESDSSLPNYYMFVKPQLDQMRMNEAQQANYWQLQQQVRAGGGLAPAGAAAGVPTTGHGAQFMNNGGYYPTKTR